MMLADNIKVTFFSPRSLFKKAIGTHIGNDGKPRTTIWWLGRNQGRAIEHVHLILHAQQQFRAAGAMEHHWTPETTERVKKAMKRADEIWNRRIETAKGTISNALNTRYSATPPVQTISLSGNVQTLYGAIDLFNAAMKGKATSESHKVHAANVLQRLKTVRLDCSLEEINFPWLDGLCDQIKSRQIKKGKRMAPATVVATLKYLRLFFVWVDDAEIGWEAPRRMMKPFRAIVADLMTPIEHRKAATIEQFDLVTLRRLYQFAKPKVQMWILAALFTGGTQMELSVLERSEFDLNEAKLSHFRNKTAIEGQFWLPPQLVELLRMSWTKKQGTLAFITRDGRPLVSYEGGGKSDAVHQAWHRLRIAADLPNALSFKFLRKFAADFALKAGGEAMGQIALSHSRTTVLSKNYSSARDFDHFHEIQKQMYAELTAAKIFEPFSKEELAAEAKAKATIIKLTSTANIVA